MEYRRIHAGEVEQAQAFAIEGMRPHLYPMHLDAGKVRGTINHFVSSWSDFHLAAFDNGKLVGGIAAAVYEAPFFERCDAMVIMFRATIPGVGRELMRRLLAWVDEQFHIRRVILPLEFDASPAMARLMRSFGFPIAQTMCVRYKD